MTLYRRILEFLKPYWKKLVIAMICMSIVSATTALYAYLVKYVIDDIFVKKDASMLYLMPFGVILLFFIKGLFFYLQAYFMGFIGQRVITNIRNLVFSSLQKQPL
jgi:subfamily B ATP-binding cassette protein MsbA